MGMFSRVKGLVTATALLSTCATSCHLVAGLEERTDVWGDPCDPDALDANPTGEDFAPGTKGQLVTLVEGTEAPRLLVEDTSPDGYLYWSSEAKGTKGGVFRVAKKATKTSIGKQIARVDGNGRVIKDLAIDPSSTYMYWIEDWVEPCNGPRPYQRVMRAKLDVLCQEGEEIAADCGQQWNRLAVDGATVYWTAAESNRIERRDVGTLSPSAIELAPETNAFAIAVDAQWIFWSDKLDSGPETIRRMDKKGENPTTYDRPAYAERMVIDSFYTFWMGENQIGRFETKDPTNWQATLEADKPGGLAVDGKNVYFTAAGQSEVMSADQVFFPLSSSIAKGQSYPQGIVVEDGILFWVNSGNNTIVRFWNK